MQTVFCVGGVTVETRDHLFFACPVSRSVWKTVLQRLGADYMCHCWDQELEAAVNSFKGNSLFARLGRCCFAITVYCIWQERNQRIFQGKYRIEDVIIRDVDSYIKARTWNWKVARNFRNWLICKYWGIESILM